MKKILSLSLSLIMILLITSCSVPAEVSNEKSNNSSKTEVNIDETEETTESTTEPPTEALIPSIDTLNVSQKALLPFYNKGFYLTSGDRDLYFMDELIATEIPIYADNVYFWTITDEFMVYFRGKPGTGEGKYLMTYDVISGETKELREWKELEKYGDAKLFMCDGKNVFIIFGAKSWYNIVQIDKNGNDTLLCKTYYGFDYNSDIDFGYFGEAMNFGEEYVFYIVGKYDDHKDSYYVKIKIDFRTGEYEIVDKEVGFPGGKGKVNSNGESYWSQQYQLLPDSMYFLPDNSFYYGETKEVVDELTGEKSTLTDVIKVNRETREEKIIGTLPCDLVSEGGGTYMTYDGNAFLTDKYFVYRNYVMSLENGKVVDYDTFVSSEEADMFFDMCD